MYVIAKNDNDTYVFTPDDPTTVDLLKIYVNKTVTDDRYTMPMVLCVPMYIGR